MVNVYVYKKGIYESYTVHKYPTEKEAINIMSKINTSIFSKKYEAVLTPKTQKK